VHVVDTVACAENHYCISFEAQKRNFIGAVQDYTKMLTRTMTSI